MTQRFEDDEARGYVAHDAFQAWRRKHEQGYFLAFKTKTRAVLHLNFGCMHPGDATWRMQDSRTGHSSLTKSAKVCSDDAQELIDWAAKEAVVWRWCKDCNDQAPEALPTSPTANPKRKRSGSEPDMPDAPAAAFNGMTVKVIEGITREVTIMASSRSRELRGVALRQSRGRCEACGVDFTKVLDGLGLRALHVHHRRQLSQLDVPVINSLEDIAVVCANCHALIHSDPLRAMAVERLRDALRGAAPPGAKKSKI